MNSDKSATKSGLVGRYLTELDLKTSCRALSAMCGGPRQFVQTRAYLNQWGIAMRVSWVSVFSTTWPSRRHLDLDDSVPSLNAVSHDKKSASVRQADFPTNLSPKKICSSATKNWLMCGGPKIVKILPSLWKDNPYFVSIVFPFFQGMEQSS